MTSQQELEHRRQFLIQSGLGLGIVALTWMMCHGRAAASGTSSAQPDAPEPLAPQAPHFPARAKSVIFLMMNGSPSQIDTFDPKPDLEKVDGQVYARENVRTSQVSGKRYFVRSPFRFRQYGKSGIPVSEPFPETAAHVDRMAILRSGYCDSDNHPAAVFQYNTGYPVQGNPSIGSWVVYGLDNDTNRSFGTRCLLARRLVERGVRFVQVWSEGWDSHDDVLHGHRAAAQQVDRPIAGRLTDLQQRGLLDETLVVWGGEFGRTANTTEAAFNKKAPGRDHNPKASLMWFAGGGVRGGTVLGATDEFGDRSVEDRHHVRDVHATLLYLLGLDQKRLTYYHGGRLKRLTDNGGDIIHPLLA